MTDHFFFLIRPSSERAKDDLRNSNPILSVLKKTNLSSRFILSSDKGKRNWDWLVFGTRKMRFELLGYTVSSRQTLGIWDLNTFGLPLKMGFVLQTSSFALSLPKLRVLLRRN